MTRGHPLEWRESGYREIQYPPQRYRIVDLPVLANLLSVDSVSSLRHAHAAWVEEAMQADNTGREAIWTESLAVGGEDFVASVKQRLGIGGRYREVISGGGDGHCLREGLGRYGPDFGREIQALRPKTSLN